MDNSLRLLVAIAFAVAASGCAHSPSLNGISEIDSGPRKYQRWTRPPELGLPEALARALAYLHERRVNLSDGYVLEASRAEESWWLDFTLLPRSPDYAVVVRVYDTGRITNGL